MKVILPCGAAFMVIAVPTQAYSAPIDITSIIERTCSLATEQAPTVPRSRLANFVLADVGISPMDLPQHDGKDLGDRMVSAIVRSHEAEASETPGPTDHQKDINALVQQLEAELSRNSRKTFRDVGIMAPSPGPISGKALSAPWLFQSAENATLTCYAKDISKDDDSGGGDTPPLRIMLRQSAQDLALSEEEFDTAGSAKFGYTRTRSRLSDGTRQTDTTWTIDSTLGLRINAATAPLPQYLFASYKRNRSRTKPSPALPSGQSQADDDIDVLELGLGAGFLVGSSQLVTNASVVNDLKDHARRLNAYAEFVPAFYNADIGFCMLGEAGDPFPIGPWNFSARCTISLIAEASHVFDAGKANFTEKDEFLLAGGRAGWELFPSGKAGPAASLFYRREWRIAGSSPSIDRIEAFLGYRAFVSESFAIDFGLTYAKGEDPKSFKPEDKLEVSFGILF